MKATVLTIAGQLAGVCVLLMAFALPAHAHWRWAARWVWRGVEHHSWHNTAQSNGPTPNGGLPNPQLTPGAFNPNVKQGNIHQTICVPGYSRSIRPPESYTEALKRQQLREYGYRDQHIWHYEEDHLVALALGGNPTSPKNLWPEPRYGRWSAERKDRMEYDLYRQVCNGQITLRTAQQALLHDWPKAYERYVAHNPHAYFWHR